MGRGAGRKWGRPGMSGSGPPPHEATSTSVPRHPRRRLPVRFFHPAKGQALPLGRCHPRGKKQCEPLSQRHRARGHRLTPFAGSPAGPVGALQPECIRGAQPQVSPVTAHPLPKSGLSVRSPSAPFPASRTPSQRSCLSSAAPQSLLIKSCPWALPRGLGGILGFPLGPLPRGSSVHCSSCCPGVLTSHRCCSLSSSMSSIFLNFAFLLTHPDYVKHLYNPMKHSSVCEML